VLQGLLPQGQSQRFWKQRKWCRRILQCNLIMFGVAQDRERLA
jgi:hypothetical protein